MNRSDVHDTVLASLDSLAGVRSVTLVGSAVDSEDLSIISDIDTVVVFDELTPERYAAAVTRVERLTGAAFGVPSKAVKVNATFGPLKFDTAECLVVHLMVYDAASHRAHVLKSPFTCFDWERSEIYRGQSLRQIYPVGRLAARDFLSARRGLDDYMNDLDAGRISYRRLDAVDGRLVEVVASHPLDARHQGEYAYHIIRNLVANALKMLGGVNRAWSNAELRGEWRTQLPTLQDWIPFYDRLSEGKARHAASFPEDTLSATRAFLEEFGRWVTALLHGSYSLRLYRHAATTMNDGTFLGQGRDPGVVDPIPPLESSRTCINTSPLRRARETAAALAPTATTITDDRLIEMNYGDAEGLTPEEVRRRNPELAAAWARAEDMAFPNGETHRDVLGRVRGYLATRPSGPGSAAAVTHNVWLRLLVAELLGLDLRHAFRIPVGHLEPIDIVRIGDRWMPNWSADVKASFLDGYTQWPPR